jgi:hypothetical protein
MFRSHREIVCTVQDLCYHESREKWEFKTWIIWKVGRDSGSAVFFIIGLSQEGRAGEIQLISFSEKTPLAGAVAGAIFGLLPIKALRGLTLDENGVVKDDESGLLQSLYEETLSLHREAFNEFADLEDGIPGWEVSTWSQAGPCWETTIAGNLILRIYPESMYKKDTEHKYRGQVLCRDVNMSLHDEEALNLILDMELDGDNLISSTRKLVKELNSWLLLAYSKAILMLRDELVY